jgi:hypothetical protein
MKSWSNSSESAGAMGAGSAVGADRSSVGLAGADGAERAGIAGKRSREGTDAAARLAVPASFECTFATASPPRTRYATTLGGSSSGGGRMSRVYAT